MRSRVGGRYDLRRGDRVVSITPSGCGYGIALERHVLAVLDDIRERSISTEAALDVYGVGVADGSIDEEATAKARWDRLVTLRRPDGSVSPQGRAAGR